MTRAFDADRPIAREQLLELVEFASWAPSAGKTQGWHLVILEGADTDRFWRHTLPAAERDDFAWQGLLRAPVIALPFADPAAYLERYSRPDKAAFGLGESEDRWPVPFWTVDAAFAAMTLLLAADDAGLGALFFGIPQGEHEVRAELGVPDGLQMIGVIALGHRSPEGDRPVTLANRPRRRTPAEIVHWSRW